MRKILLVFIFIILISNISASCDEGQIDINTATAEELDEIVHVGPAVAGYIIDARPFESLDELVNVKYISEGYLEDIREQDLACVNGFEENEEDESEEETENNDDSIEEKVSQETENPELQTIFLNPQVIKTDENKEEVSKNYALYGFVAFCILIVILFMIKNRKDKNEFR